MSRADARITVTRGEPDACELAALLVVLALLPGAVRRAPARPRPVPRPRWQPERAAAPGPAGAGRAPL